MLNAATQDAKTLFSLPACHINSMAPPVKLDTAKKSITLFMPGFDKSEIKLYQVCPIPSIFPNMFIIFLKLSKFVAVV